MLHIWCKKSSNAAIVQGKALLSSPRGDLEFCLLHWKLLTVRDNLKRGRQEHKNEKRRAKQAAMAWAHAALQSARCFGIDDADLLASSGRDLQLKNHVASTDSETSIAVRDDASEILASETFFLCGDGEW